MRKRYELRLIAVAVAAALTTGGVAAQEQLEEIFVTGSRISRAGFDAPTLSARYTLPQRTERSWELFATINNLFDEDPPLAPGAYPTNAAFFDQVGRFYRVGVRADF